jgi:hypothetical protein
LNDEHIEEHTPKNFFFPDHKTIVTRNLYLFLKDYYDVIDLFFFTTSLVTKADESAVAASKALIKMAKTEEEKQRYQRIIDNPDKMGKIFGQYSNLHSKNLCINIVDSFLWFISATIQTSMRKRPEIAKSGEMIKIEDIFEYTSKKELINYIIDRKVNSLSYGGMSKVEKFINDSLGLQLYDDDDSRKMMNIFNEIRNIHVHNRGYANRIFMSRIPTHEEFSFKESERVHLDFDNLVKLSNICVETAMRLDAGSSEKFGIKRKRYSTWKLSHTIPGST